MVHSLNVTKPQIKVLKFDAQQYFKYDNQLQIFHDMFPYFVCQILKTM